MTADISPRVRFHAWQAVQAMVGPEESAHLFPIRVPTSKSLILISEDSHEYQMILCSLCSQMDLQVRTASSEHETIALASALKPQAIITDNQKGKDNLSGLNMTWDLCRRPELRETIIFMWTADFIEPQFLWNGGDCFLSKASAELGDLANVIMAYFGLKSQIH